MPLYHLIKENHMTEQITYNYICTCCHEEYTSRSLHSKYCKKATCQYKKNLEWKKEHKEKSKQYQEAYRIRNYTAVKIIQVDTSSYQLKKCRILDCDVYFKGRLEVCPHHAEHIRNFYAEEAI
jgi:hypothetical protein